MNEGRDLNDIARELHEGEMQFKLIQETFQYKFHELVCAVKTLELDLAKTLPEIALKELKQTARENAQRELNAANDRKEKYVKDLMG